MLFSKPKTVTAKCARPKCQNYCSRTGNQASWCSPECERIDLGRGVIFCSACEGPLSPPSGHTVHRGAPVETGYALFQKKGWEKFCSLACHDSCDRPLVITPEIEAQAERDRLARVAEQERDPEGYLRRLTAAANRSSTDTVLENTQESSAALVEIIQLRRAAQQLEQNAAWTLRWGTQEKAAKQLAEAQAMKAEADRLEIEAKATHDESSAFLLTIRKP